MLSAFSPFPTIPFFFPQGHYPFPNKPCVLRVCISSILKARWKKGEIVNNDNNEQFLLFPQCFLPIWRAFCHFHQI